MKKIQADMNSLRRELSQGSIQRAYGALLRYMMELRTHFRKRYPEHKVSALYQGSLDWTFFSIVPPSLKRHDLKIALIFNYELFRFEAWLAARNRQVQRKYWKLFQETDWPRYRVKVPSPGIDSIIECDLVDQPDFGEPRLITEALEKGLAAFVEDLEGYLAGREASS